MSPQIRNARDIFLQAVELSEHEWEPYLDEECSDDDDLKRRVRDLLSAHQGNDSFLDQQPATTPLVITESSGDTIGSYKLLQQIGEGGFGVVFMAEQTKPIRRKVALKVIKPGMDTKEVVARFEAERQALAVMDHPNIAKVFDAGATDRGRPYFVMELVKGVPLTQYADANHLSTDERLDLFVQICRAVHHAHQKGIIHRDLKPSNVLVTLHDGLPVPKVIDFGVAKAINQPLTEKTMFTQFGQTIGTPQYMSPEQAELSGLDIDTRSDVYSLGVILYELLTGQTPFTVEQMRKAGLDEMRRVIREQEPVRPSNILETFDADTATFVASHRSSKPEQLRKSIRGELDWIVLKALEKDRQRRYDTASSFAEDIENHIHHEPVLASPPTLGYQCWKFYQRYEAACKVALTISALLVVAITATTGLWIKEKQSRQEAMTAMIELDEQRQVAEQSADEERKAKASAQSTLTLLIDMLSKAGINPETGKEYTVSDALSSLASSSLLNQSVDSEGQLNAVNLPPNVLADLHRELGKAYLRAGKGDRAIEHLQISFAQSNEFSGRQSLQSAECLRYLGEAKNSPEHLREAIDIYDALNKRREVLFTRIALGRLFLVSDDLDSAKTTLHRACRDFDQLNPRVDLIDIPHLLLSRVYQGMNLESEEETYFDSAMRIAVSRHGRSSDDWLHRATTHYNHQRYWEAEFASLVSLRLGRKGAEYRLAYSYYQNGTLVRAIDYMRQSYDYYAELGEANGAHLRAERLARFYTEHGDVASAAKCLGDAVRWALKMKDGDGNRAISNLLVLAESSPEAKRIALDLANELSELESEDADVATNVASTLGFMRLSGYPVGSDESKVIEPYKFHLKSLARDGHFDTAFDFGKRSCAYESARNSLSKLSWRQMRCARLLYQCLDFTSAIEFQQYAVDASQRKQGDNRRQTAWANLELAHILYFGGETEKAMSLASDTLAEIQNLNTEKRYVSHALLDPFSQWQLRVIANGKPGARIVLEEAANIEAGVLGEIGIRWSNLALGMAHEELGNHRDAIDAYETAVRLKYEWPSYPQFHFDDRLLELLDRTDQLDRGKQIFTDVLETRREDLPVRHPMIGLTRLRLADVLVRSGEDAERAIELLDQARETMQLHKMTPQHVFDRIDRLAKQAKSL